MGSELSIEDRRRLLGIARRAIADALAGRPPAPDETDGALGRRSGAFVSLHRRGDLRGCIGYPDGDRPLGSVVAHCAVSAATGDPRFPAVRPDELDQCVIEISVLGPLSPVADPADITVGRHGLIVEQGRRRGLLLPQVAVEYGWDRDTFLARTCGKAGLPADAWKQGASIVKFEAEVFDDATASER